VRQRAGDGRGQARQDLVIGRPQKSEDRVQCLRLDDLPLACLTMTGACTFD
jgi:hypothetical protein